MLHTSRLLQMDFVRNIKYRLTVLDQQGLIDIAWLQRWTVLLAAVFFSILYLWDWFVTEDDPTSHFPPGLLPFELRKKIPPHGFTSHQEAREFSIREIEVAIIACKKFSDAADESAIKAVTMMKSAVLQSKSVIHFHIFTEDQLYGTFMKELDEWPPHIRHRVSFKFSHVTYPESLLGWKNLKRPCSPFKLFLPHVLKDLDYVLFIENDSLILNSLDQLWRQLLQYNDSQALSLTKLHVGDKLKQPFSEPLSRYKIPVIDSGVVLFDIFRLRHTVFKVPSAIRSNHVDNIPEFEFTNVTYHPNMLHSLYTLFQNEITSPDRDIFSILSYFNPDKVHGLPCAWNFRWNYCAEVRKAVQSKFLKAIIKDWTNATMSPACEYSFLVHEPDVQDAMSDELMEILRSAYYNDSFGDFSANVSSLFQNLKQNIKNDCLGVNTRLFTRSMKAGIPCR